MIFGVNILLTQKKSRWFSFGSFLIFIVPSFTIPVVALDIIVNVAIVIIISTNVANNFIFFIFNI